MVGDYECPDLFKLLVNGTTQSKYVFWSGGGTYLIGTFDGKRFTPSSAPQHAEFGDGYAAQTYFGEPRGRRLQISWLGHFASKSCSQKTDSGPFTSGFIGQMSIPMELDLVSLPTGLSLRRRPVKELNALRRARIFPHLKDEMLTSDQPLVAPVTDPRAGIEFVLQVQAPSHSNVKLQVELLGQEILLDMRSKVFQSNLTVGMAFQHTEQVSARALLHTSSGGTLPVQVDEIGDITIHVIVDRLSLEIFDVTGGASMALCTVARYNNKDGKVYQHVRMATIGGPARIREATIYELVT
jgi:sucrose-6-phosphate hydrolase SacC (GH32 family)